MNEIVPIDGIELIKSYVGQSYAKNTILNYESRIKLFREWGGKLPCSPEMLAYYISENAKDKSPATLKQHLWAISLWHKKNKFEDPTNHPAIIDAMRGIKRAHNKPTRRARPLLLQDIDTLYNLMKDSEKPSDLRDLALIAIGFHGAFRRSELVGIKYEHLEFTDKGLSILIPVSKTDQFQEGQMAYIKYGPFGESKHCPIAILSKWLEFSKIKKGHIFTSIRTNGSITIIPLEGVAVLKTLNKIQSRYGIEGNSFTGHSLRRGIVTSAARAGAPGASLQKLGRWKNFDQVVAYMEEAQGFQGLASEFLLSSSKEANGSIATSCQAPS